MSKDEIAYRIRLMFYSIFAVVFAFLFIAISSYLKITETAALKQTDQIKLNIVDGLKVRERILFEEFSTNNFESIAERIKIFLTSQRIDIHEVNFIKKEQCANLHSKLCGILNSFPNKSEASIQSLEMLGDVYISLPMQGWGESLGVIIVSFPRSEISSTPTVLEKVAIYILPFVFLGFLIYCVFSVAESRIVRPTINRIIETEKVKAQQSIIRQFAHDIKSPILALETVMDSSLQVDESRFLLKETILRIKEISEDLLEWDRSFIRLNEVDIRKLLDSIVEEKRVHFNSTALSISYDIDESLKFILLNKIDFYRAISNLLNNAIEACNNSIMIKIAISYVETNLHVAISDNGPGILPEKIALILAGEYSSKHDGHGLGVSGAKSWVEKMNGVFCLESNVGLGTTVRMTFPATII